MFLVAVIWGLIVGNVTQLQLKYDHCKEINFESEYCKTQKKLNEFEDK